MLKFSWHVFHYHQPPDAYSTKVLFNRVIRRGREFLEKVRNGKRVGTTTPETSTLPNVVCSTARSAGYWQKSAAAWKDLVNGFLARNQSGGFVARYAKSCRSQCAFGSWHERSGYAGLARKVALFGFVGVAVSGNGKLQQFGFSEAGNDNIYSTIRDMFTVELKQSSSELSVSINSLDDLHLDDVIATDGAGTVFSAHVTKHHLEPESSVEAVLVKNVEMVGEQTHQMAELLHMAQIQNTHLKQLISTPTDTDDDTDADVADSSVLMTSIDWSADSDEMLENIETYIMTQSLTMADIAAILCRQNAELRAANVQLQSSVKSETGAEESTYCGQDDDDEGFVVISEGDDMSWCDIADHSDLNHDPFPTQIYFADRRETSSAGAGQHDIELTQLSEVKAVNNTVTEDSKSSAKNSMVDTQDKMATVMVRVEMISSDDIGLSLSDDSLMSHVDLVWWSHPTKPPDVHWRRHTELPSHFNVIKRHAGFVTNITNITRLLGRHYHMLHGLPVTFAAHRDFAICTVMKPMKMSLGEFLSSHSIDITQCHLLLLQLMESVIHLSNYNISSTCVNGDSVFIEFLNDEPHLVVADFGYRVSTDEKSPSSSTNEWSNELKSVVNLSSQILSACSRQSRQSTADGREFNVPLISLINKLMRCLLKAESHVRPDTVANLLHILLWTPRDQITGLECGSAEVDEVTISWTLVCLAAHSLLCQQSPTVTHSLRRIFLSRVNSRDIFNALNLLRTLH